MRPRLLFSLALAGATLWSSEALAGRYDLDLTPLGRRSGSMVDPDNVAFRSLASELGTVMAPKPVDTADSLGISGFSVSGDFSINTISANRGYWSDTTGGDAKKSAPSMQIMGRKGLWPGIEVGGGATHLFDSRMWAINGYGKISLHEGFHHLPIPAISLKGSFSRLLGAKDFNMTTAAPSVTISHTFGVGRTVNFTPYIGYEALFIIASSTVLDATPSCDEYQDDYNEDDCDPTVTRSEFVFKKADGAIVRHRPYLGLRFVFSVIRIVAEAMIVPAGTSEGKVDGRTIKDGSGVQQQYTLSVGADF